MTQEDTPDIYEYIGKRIRALREESRLSQDALAQSIKVSANTISRWESATYKPSIGDLEKLSNFFKIRVSSFLPQEEIETQSKNFKALLSATGDLPDSDVEEIIEYANFRKLRHLTKKPTEKRDE